MKMIQLIFLFIASSIIVSEFGVKVGVAVCLIVWVLMPITYKG